MPLGQLWRSSVLGAMAALLSAAPLAAAAAVAVEITVDAKRPGAVISRNLYGQFAEHLGFGIYGGIWVGEDSKIPNTSGYRNDVVAALRQLEVPVVRWPGGCFADEYHWREGIGPRDRRPVRVNTHWGGVEETNAFGTHEFLNFAELIGADAYVAGNVGNGTPEEMAAWVEYMTSDTRSTLANERRANGREQPWNVPYFGVGNELWGCGGNMRAEYAADLYRRYQTFVKSPRQQRINKVAAGANGDDYHWTDVFMREAREQMDAVSMHHYTISGTWAEKGSATDFDEAAWIEILSRTLRMDELIRRHSAIMDKYDPEKRVALFVDEWGTWYSPLPDSNPGFLQQQNSLRDALVAAINLNIFQQHAQRVKMANIAQMVNVLQAMILTDNERMVLTPTYHVFDMYKPFKEAIHLPLEIATPDYSFGKFTVPAVHASAARGADNRIHLALANLDPNHSTKVRIKLVGTVARSASGRLLTAPAINTINTFDQPDAVRPVDFKGATLRGDELTLNLPSKSVVVIELRP